MDINRANLSALFKTFQTAWQQGLEQRPEDNAAFVATEFPSSTASNFYAWMDKVPGFRKWVGDRVYANVTGQRFEVVNEDYEDSVRLSVNDIEDDQYGVYAPIISMMAQNWLELKREKTIEVFTANKGTFTGYALVSDSHDYGDYALDNKATDALSATSFEAAIEAAAAWQFSDGTLVKPRWTHLVVGDKLRNTAWNIVVNTKIQDSSATIDNPNSGRVALAVWPELQGDYDDYWFLVDASRPIKPVALQIRKEAAPLMDTDPAQVERTGYVDFLGSGRLAAAPTFPHLVYGGLVA